MGTPLQYQDTYAFLLGYRDHHLPGKTVTFRALQRLIDAIDQQNLFLSDADLPRKGLLVNAFNVNTMSYGFSIVEDFLRIADALIRCHDLRELPHIILQYRRPGFFRDVAKQLANGQDHIAGRVLWYLSDEEVTELSFFSQQEKQFIIRLHHENIQHVGILFRSLDRLYTAYSDAHNKYKHGYPFLFGETGSLSGTPLESLGVMIPYFCDSEAITKTGAIPVGPGVLRRLRTIIDGTGGLISTLQDVVSNSSFGCKIGGQRIVALQAFGPNALDPKFVEEGNQLSERYLRAFGVTGVPERMEMKIQSKVARANFEWLLQIPE